MAGVLLAGCGRPLPLPTENTRPHWSSDSLGAAERARLAAQEAERIEAAERADAIDLLRTLAGRYRESRRPNAIEKLEYASAPDRRSLSAKPATAPQKAPPAHAKNVIAPKILDNDALREHFAGLAEFDRLVNRCLDVVTDNTSRAQQPGEKLFGWLCRASILPQAGTSIGAGTPSDDPKLRELGTDIERLMRLAGKCAETPSATCEDVDRTIDQIITQQPIAPVPVFHKKIAVDRTAIPPPGGIVSAVN